MQSLGKYIIALGAVILLAGFIIWLWGDKLHWFGNLPGDIHIKKENVKVFIPITSMLLLSIVFSLFLWLFRKFF